MGVSPSAATMEINMKVPQESKGRTTIWSHYTKFGHISKEM
jgi:hypothetical protein